MIGPYVSNWQVLRHFAANTPDPGNQNLRSGPESDFTSGCKKWRSPSEPQEKPQI